MQCKALSKHALSLIAVSLLSQTASIAQFSVRVERQQTKRIQRPGVLPVKHQVGELPHLAPSAHGRLTGQLRSDQFHMDATARLQPKPAVKTSPLAGQSDQLKLDAEAQLQLMQQNVSENSNTNQSTDDVPKLGTSLVNQVTPASPQKSSVDYAAAEEEYAKMAPQPAQATVQTTGASVPVITQKTHIEGHVDPMEGKVPIVIDDKGNTHYRPDLKAEVCECGTEIPSSECLQRRAGVGLYANQKSSQAAPRAGSPTSSIGSNTGRR